jgi:4-hydroxybenzoate polyprenyltransferase
MKVFVGLFLTSGVFGLIIAIVYWFASHEYAGTLLLGFMFFGLSFAAGYAMIAERNADIPGDDPQRQLKEAAGEDVGIVTKESAWPTALAFSILLFFIGLIWSDFLLFTGLAAMLLCLWRLGAESARAGITEEGTKIAE